MVGHGSGRFISTMIRPEWHSEPTTGLVRWLIDPLYFGGIWLPLLMLVPYAILLNPEWRDTLTPNLYKIPLVFAWVLGLLLVMAPKIVVTMDRLSSIKEKRDNPQSPSNNSMEIIDYEQSIEDLLYFLDREKDEPLRIELLAKIKAHKNWEAELERILRQKNPYVNYRVYAFLDYNKIEHPERFTEPINNNIPILTSRIQETINDPNNYDLEYLNIDVFCRVLDAQFKDSSAVFRPNILKLHEALETPPVERNAKIDTKQAFVEMRNKYRLAVKNWLDSN
ncbi:MAG: hypothetical protein IPJ40_08580 [Saprospirales bacterium]|nr:hypothetical protein [Saprospirales bacterium]